MEIALSRVTASRPVKCSLCATVIFPGEIFWWADAHSICICRGHIPVNTRGFTTAEPDESPFHVIRPDCLDVAKDLLPAIIASWDAIYGIGPEAFEELICDRLSAMGLQAFRTGHTNRKDGGIDICFWTPPPLRALGAVQVKHRQSSTSKPIGPDVVRNFASVLSPNGFSIGLIVTNGEFSDDAKWHAQEKTVAIQLRDGASVRMWIADDFSGEVWNSRMRTVQLCPGIEMQLPQFL